MKKIIIAAFIVFLSYGCGQKTPIKIGFAGNLSGKMSDLGTDARNGAILAVEKINSEGGIDGRDIELIVKDDEGNAETAKKIDQELIDEKVSLIIGHVLSGMSLAALPLMNEKQMLLFSPTSVSNAFTGKDDFFIRTSAATKAAIDTFADYTFQTLKINKVSFVYDLSNKGYTEDWYKNFSSRFEKIGGSVKKVKTYTSNPDNDYGKLVQDLAFDDQAIVIVGGPLDAALICQQIRKFNSKTPILIAGSAVAEALIQNGGKSVEGVFLSYNFDQNSEIPQFKEFKEAFQKRFGNSPNFTAKYSYETVMVIQSVLTGMKDPDPVKIKKAILDKAVFEGLQGKIELDANGDAQPAVFFFTVENGKFKRIY
ncbi:MAG TPA: hypothetical protein DHW82_13395 [Spirochaetia bacterium]|nr:MAG: hypothetical protein A2Y41_07595 [Spirochaetes bacterium GWB1_36_13]HCL57984.1 hypothetical protein [Spirochaetia bacterium]